MGQPFGIPQVAETGGNRRQMHRKQDARCIEIGEQFLDSSRMMSYARVVIFCSWYAVPEQVGPVARYIYVEAEAKSSSETATLINGCTHSRRPVLA